MRGQRRNGILGLLCHFCPHTMDLFEPALSGLLVRLLLLNSFHNILWSFLAGSYFILERPLGDIPQVAPLPRELFDLSQDLIFGKYFL